MVEEDKESPGEETVFADGESRVEVSQRRGKLGVLLMVFGTVCSQSDVPNVCWCVVCGGGYERDTNNGWRSVVRNVLKKKEDQIEKFFLFCKLVNWIGVWLGTMAVSGSVWETMRLWAYFKYIFF